VKAAARMPLLEHYRRGEPFNISKSEVVKWLCRQPEIQQQFFNYYKACGAIVFDIETGGWHGSNWSNQ
jgi:hypothetical protein